jgi:signal transduction histidine kinase
MNTFFPTRLTMEDAGNQTHGAAAQVPTQERRAGEDHHDVTVTQTTTPPAYHHTLPQVTRSRVDAARRWLASCVTLPTWLPPGWRRPWIGYLASVTLTAGVAAVLTTLSIATHGFVQFASPLLLVDILVALTFGPGPSLIAALFGTVLIDYFINPPHFAWSHADPGKAITLVVLALVGCAISLLASRVAHARTEAEALAEELRESQRESVRRVDEFLGVASHELKTPLTTILANVQLAARKAQNLEKMMRARSLDLDALERMPAELAMMLERTERQARRQERLVNDLLEMSRAQAGRLELDLTECDLVALVRDVADEQRLAHPTRHLTVSVASADEAGLLATADGHRIEQVLTNFLSNALKYSPEDAPVTVMVGSEQDIEGRRWARVSVSDQGPGLSTAEQAQVWDRFYRVPGLMVQSGSGIGLGLGLFISREIVKRHNGHIGVESTPGAGATFWFSVPLEQR